MDKDERKSNERSQEAGASTEHKQRTRANEHGRPCAGVKRARPGSGDKHRAQTTPASTSEGQTSATRWRGQVQANTQLSGHKRGGTGRGGVSGGWRGDKRARGMRRQRQQERQQQGRGRSGSISGYRSSTCSICSSSRSRGTCPPPPPAFYFSFYFYFYFY